jgi:cytoskeletal protein RodZ
MEIKNSSEQYRYRYPQNKPREEKGMHTADLQEDKAMGRRVGMTVLVLFVVMVGLIIVANLIS